MDDFSSSLVGTLRRQIALLAYLPPYPCIEIPPKGVVSVLEGVITMLLFFVFLLRYGGAEG